MMKEAVETMGCINVTTVLVTLWLQPIDVATWCNLSGVKADVGAADR